MGTARAPPPPARIRWRALRPAPLQGRSPGAPPEPSCACSAPRDGGLVSRVGRFLRAAVPWPVSGRPLPRLRVPSPMPLDRLAPLHSVGDPAHATLQSDFVFLRPTRPEPPRIQLNSHPHDTRERLEVPHSHYPFS